MKRAAVYLRVSTDQQTTDNQLRELNAVVRQSAVAAPFSVHRSAHLAKW
jgi:DNA invertase Pin-like site-specific DNA recombinase